MKVADLMSRFVEFIEPGALVRDVAVMMGELEVGALPVGSADRVEGIVTDRDILYRVVARGLDSSAVRVSEILSRPVVSCREDDDVQAAMDMLAANHIRRLPVMDAQGSVSGWITLADISRHVLLENESLQESLRKLSADAA